MNDISMKIVHEDGVNKITILNDTVKMARYTLYRRLVTNCFDVTVNEDFTPLGVVTADDGLVCRYEDSQCFLNDAPLPPTILNKYKTGANSLFISADSYNVGYKYEYYAEEVGTGRESNRVSVITDSIIDRYEYQVNKTDRSYDESILMPEHNIFEKVTKGNFVVENLHEGYNVIFIRAVSNSNVIGDFTRVFVDVIKDDPNFPNKTSCIGIPNGVRYNNRYRGPQESKKTDRMYAQARANINKLKAKFDMLDVLKDNVLQKPNLSSISTVEKIEELELILADIRKEIAYEQRND